MRVGRGHETSSVKLVVVKGVDVGRRVDNVRVVTIRANNPFIDDRGTSMANPTKGNGCICEAWISVAVVRRSDNLHKDHGVLGESEGSY
jgi:hypothetical protein